MMELSDKQQLIGTSAILDDAGAGAGSATRRAAASKTNVL